MRAYRDFLDVIESLGDAEPSRGLVLVDSRFRESHHSYADLHRRVRAVARQFRAQGVRQGHRILMPLATDADTIASFLALQWLGAVPFSVAAPLIGQEREAYRRQMVRLVAKHGVDRLLVSPDLAGIVGVYPETPAELALTVSPPTPAELEDPSPVERAQVKPDDVVFVQFSSGSTAQPKGVRITHRGLLNNLGIIVENDRRTSEDVVVSWLPLYHDMGLVGCLLSNFMLKNRLVLMHPRCFMTRPITWLAAITRYRGTVTAVPHFALDVCTERITEETLRMHPLDLSTFRYIYDGSEPVRVPSIRRFEEKFGPHGFVPGGIFPVYGMAETTLIVSAPCREEGTIVREIEGMEIPSVGYPLGDFAVEIRDDGGATLERERIGEIHVRGASVTPGYLETSDSPSEAIRDGWLATGDLGLLDRDGRLYITGRKKDILIVGGRNFYAHEIALRLEEGLRLRTGSAYVFSIERREREEIVVMMAAPKGGDEARGDDAVSATDPEGLDRSVRRLVLREFGLAVDDVCLVPRIPKTSSGKVVRHLCQEIYLEERGRLKVRG